MRFIQNSLNKGLFAESSASRMQVPTVFMSYEEQCKAILEGDDDKLYHFKDNHNQVCGFTNKERIL